ncbi:flagellar hook-length control protein FliK [bacterium]|nr:flagellar hook-length control protein FliK [bacterium]
MPSSSPTESLSMHHPAIGTAAGAIVRDPFVHGASPEPLATGPQTMSANPPWVSFSDQVGTPELASLGRLLADSSVKVTQLSAVLPPVIADSSVDMEAVAELPVARGAHVPVPIQEVSSKSIPIPSEANLGGEDSDQAGQAREDHPIAADPDPLNPDQQGGPSTERSPSAQAGHLQPHPVDGQGDQARLAWRRQQSRQLLHQSRHLSLRLESDTLGEVTARLEREAGGQWTASLTVCDSAAEARLIRELEQLQDQPLATGSGLSSFTTTLMQPGHGDMGQRFRPSAGKKLVITPNFRDSLPIEGSAGGGPPASFFQQSGRVNIRV